MNEEAFKRVTGGIATASEEELTQKKSIALYKVLTMIAAVWLLCAAGFLFLMNSPGRSLVMVAITIPVIGAGIWSVFTADE